MIDVTMTATKRPDIIKRTVESFCEKMFDDADEGFRLIVNIDPVGEEIDPAHIVKMLRGYFTEVVWREPTEPDFAKAFKWTWGQTKSDFVFHLEDDWELMRRVDFDELKSLLLRNKDTAVIRLPAFFCDGAYMKNWNKWLGWAGEFFEAPQEQRVELGFCGHPSLIRGCFVRTAAELLMEDKNPEKQFHYWNARLVAEVKRWRFGVFTDGMREPMVKDIGRRWMLKSGFRKEGVKAFFMRWAPV